MGQTHDRTHRTSPIACAGRKEFRSVGVGESRGGEELSVTNHHHIDKACQAEDVSAKQRRKRREQKLRAKKLRQTLIAANRVPGGGKGALASSFYWANKNGATEPRGLPQTASVMTITSHSSHGQGKPKQPPRLDSFVSVIDAANMSLQSLFDVTHNNLGPRHSPDMMSQSPLARARHDDDVRAVDLQASGVASDGSSALAGAASAGQLVSHGSVLSIGIGRGFGSEQKMAAGQATTAYHDKYNAASDSHAQSGMSAGSGHQRSLVQKQSSHRHHAHHHPTMPTVDEGDNDTAIGAAATGQGSGTAPSVVTSGLATPLGAAAASGTSGASINGTSFHGETGTEPRVMVGSHHSLAGATLTPTSGVAGVGVPAYATGGPTTSASAAPSAAAASFGEGHAVSAQALAAASPSVLAQQAAPTAATAAGLRGDASSTMQRGGPAGVGATTDGATSAASSAVVWTTVKPTASIGTQTMRQASAVTESKEQTLSMLGAGLTVDTNTPRPPGHVHHDIHDVLEDSHLCAEWEAATPSPRKRRRSSVSSVSSHASRASHASNASNASKASHGSQASHATAGSSRSTTSVTAGNSSTKSKDGARKGRRRTSSTRSRRGSRRGSRSGGAKGKRRGSSAAHRSKDAVAAAAAQAAKRFTSHIRRDGKVWRVPKIWAGLFVSDDEANRLLPQKVYTMLILQLYQGKAMADSTDLRTGTTMASLPAYTVMNMLVRFGTRRLVQQRLTRYVSPREDDQPAPH